MRNNLAVDAAVMHQVDALKEVRTNKIVQTSRADDNPYCALFHYSLLLITLSVSETIPQSRLRRAGSPAGEPMAVLILCFQCEVGL